MKEHEWIGCTDWRTRSGNWIHTSELDSAERGISGVQRSGEKRSSWTMLGVASTMTGSGKADQPESSEDCEFSAGGSSPSEWRVDEQSIVSLFREKCEGRSCWVCVEAVWQALVMFAREPEKRREPVTLDRFGSDSVSRRE